MALMPGAEHRLLPENAGAVRIQPTQLIVHSIVGSAEGAYRYFRDRTNVESTFIVAKDGRIIQLMDTERQADANYLANVRAGSVETEDNGNPDTDPWTPAQLRSLLRIARFYHERHGVPRRLCPRWDAPGFGYHRLFPEWSTVRGKTCPGHIRVRQFHEVLLPAIVAGRWPDTEEDTDMGYRDWPKADRDALRADLLDALRDELRNYLLPYALGGVESSVYSRATVAHGDRVRATYDVKGAVHDEGRATRAYLRRVLMAGQGTSAGPGPAVDEIDLPRILGAVDEVGQDIAQLIQQVAELAQEVCDLRAGRGPGAGTCDRTPDTSSDGDEGEP